MTEGHNKKIKVFHQGMKDGLPIGLGYFAVSFTLGIAARNAGLTAFQAFIASFFCNASAGEYAGFTLIAANAAYFEVIAVTFIANVRYMLMSCAMSQRMSPDTGLGHRLLMGFDITDELFGIVIARPGYLSPTYMYGAMLVSIPCWATGTALGVIAGNILPLRVVSALSVALFGMFLAVIIPPSRKNKIVAVLVLISFGASYAFSRISWFSTLSDGMRTIILTVAISAVAALLFPVKEKTEEKQDEA